MPRDLPIGNGQALLAFDGRGLLREFHYPHVGEENHAGELYRIGVWVDGQLSWIPEGWEVKRDYLPDTLVAQIEWIHPGFGLRILSNDLVDFVENLYLKKLRVENLREEEREIRLFLAHDFHIYGNDIGDTAAFRPEAKALLHYKKERYFLINIRANHKYGIDLFATGNEGTWKDAEDGVLSQNPIAQGAVDSVLAIPLTLRAHEAEECFYWIAMGKNWTEVEELNTRVRKKTPEEIFQRTSDYWKAWVEKEPLEGHLSARIASLYKKSLLICQTQINLCGSIIAANDSDAIHFNRDTYSYMWPRDGALVAYAMDLAGYSSAEFFLFCAKIMEKDGYFLHKYMPTGAPGSSWHPWMNNGAPQLPIQEDETALVLWALWKHYERFKDLALIRSLYFPLIKRGADFMMNYRHFSTGLPLPSYDLWEERQGILTFTTAAAIGGLQAASRFAHLFGEKSLAEEYSQGAATMRQAMEQHLYLPEKKRFARMIHLHRDGSIEVDATLDASLYGLIAFGAFRADEEKARSTLDQVFDRLEVNGGIIRYENDAYYRENDTAPSNPWFVTTLWKAQTLIAQAKNKSDLEKALPIFEWVADHALPSGVLPEQISGQTNEPRSVSPLTWSHGAFIAAIQQYLRKAKAI